MYKKKYCSIDLIPQTGRIQIGQKEVNQIHQKPRPSLRVLLVHARATWSGGGWLEPVVEGSWAGEWTGTRTYDLEQNGDGMIAGTQAGGVLPGQRECPLDDRSGGEATWLEILIEVGGGKAQDPIPAMDALKNGPLQAHEPASPPCGLVGPHPPSGEPPNLPGHRPWTPMDSRARATCLL
jgi:hypothetical protein